MYLILFCIASYRLFLMIMLSQYRNNNKTPYWYHLRDVVNNLEMMGIDDESILCAGWLHDSIEDTSFDFDDIL